MIRLAWHCNGSYRESDGRGGCDGGRIRFDPELNWPDNANLNNALKLLEPIKEKYGSKLSWGDLIVLAGTTAIEYMGGPVLGFCGGRVDDIDGSDSLILGPSPEQEELTPCQSIGKQGMCDSPLGPTTMGLIYVNPEGPVTAPGDPLASGVDIRDAFSRMGFNDRETVALVGGGHAFGKSHGACATPPCGEEPMVGIGPNTFTSGIEGAWTTIPTTWSNQYFTNLFNYEWEQIRGPGGAIQYQPNVSLPIMMQNTDIAFSVDSDYLPITQEFANNITALEEDFAHVWYRLMVGDMGPPVRCINENPEDIPPPQWWQHPIPESNETDAEVDYFRARAMVQDMIDEDEDNIAAFSNLALRCASTFRATDYRGGCNGAKIRFPPESEWPENEGTAEALATLEPIKQAVPGISYADLIVLAGQTAIEAASDVKLSFCGGRGDALDAAGSEILAPRYHNTSLLTIRDDMQVKGLTPHEGVALFAIPTSTDDLTSISRATGTNNELSNEYFINLLARADDAMDDGYSEFELALLDPEFKPIVEEYAEDEELFLEVFSAAWTKMMNADRFDGPVGNICDSRNDLQYEMTGDDMENKSGDSVNQGNPDSAEMAASAGVVSAPRMVAGLLAAVAAVIGF
jgi:catalase-peroxidase